MENVNTKNLNKKNLVQENFDMEAELSSCRKSAAKGYQIALQKYEDLAITLRKVDNNINKAEAEQSQLSRFQASALIRKQNHEIDYIREHLIKIRNNIDALHERQKDFSIAVFGRKSAGKTTLMEILTHGDGSTTENNGETDAQNIQTYYWKGLKITSLPDFNFFNSVEKDKLGMEAAESADLVLFLLTNEKPQPEEVQCMAQLKKLGKPILCVVNVKKNLKSKKTATLVKEIEKDLNAPEVAETIEEFKNHLKSYELDFSDIKFIPVHLAAAYAYQVEGKNDAEIYLASNFGKIEELIVQKIRTDGEFLRIKNFVDSVAVPMNQIVLKLFEQSGNSLKESKFWRKKYNEIKIWRQSFWEHAQNKIHKLFNDLSYNLNHEIPNFVEENYNNPKVKEEWTKHVEQFGYVARYQELLEKISKDCEEQFKKFSNDFTQELKMNFDGKTQTDIELDNAPDWENYAAIALPNLLMLVPEIGWTARVVIGVSDAFFTTLFMNKETKIRRAKENLASQLQESGKDMMSKINNQARDILNKQILGNVEDFSNMLVGYSYMLAQLGKTQSEFAETLLSEYNDLNEILFSEAARYKRAGDVSEMRNTIRIPGEFSAILAEKITVDEAAISALLNEKFVTIKLQDSWNDLMRDILGCDFELDVYPISPKVDGKTYTVTPKEKISANVFKMAQQISPYPIIRD